jgi:arginyl-tRNA synthetase
VDLLKKILAFPEAVKRAANTEDPVKIAEHITSIATLFNSYYNSTPILKGDRVEQGIVIAHCASLVINNGLRMLHIGMLERI